ncbi:hypothetical protein AB8A20_20845 [Tardiphaga sp. 604_B6_N1_1]|uniref:hypothetical protein n=1 Tax=Tardiphaga sp. 604_B6_N1_1 TaxID=3240779 RepID=UPI003F1F8320
MPELPKKAAAKWSRLLRIEADAQALTNSCLREISEANRLLDNAPHGPRAPSLRAVIIEGRARLVELQQRHREAAALNTHLMRWLERNRIVELEDLPAARPRLLKGETAVDAVTRVRDRIAALRSEYTAIEGAMLPIGNLKVLVRSHVQALADRARPRIVAESDKVEVTFRSKGEGWSNKPDLEGLLAWLDPAAFEARLCEELAGTAGTSLRLSPEDKSVALSKLRAEMDAFEREEEALIEMATDTNGVTIERRASADPGAILFVVRKRGAATAA